MHSAVPRRLPRLLRKIRGAVTVFALAGATVVAGRAPLSGQADSSPTAAGMFQASAIPPGNPVAPLAAPALPPLLIPPALNPDAPVTLQDGEPMVPVLFAIFGGIAGMFVGDWWMQRDCKENCEERGFIGLLAGGILGMLVGWMIGGGEIPEESPPSWWP
jgi:hypothetical protein